MPGVHIKDFGKAFEKTVKRAGLQGITPDCLRHTFATKPKGHVRRLADLREIMGHSSDRHTVPFLFEELEDKRATVEELPVPANFTTVLENWMEEPPQDEHKVRDSQGVGMVSPWGLEPQTSTVSILRMRIAAMSSSSVSGSIHAGLVASNGHSRHCC